MAKKQQQSIELDYEQKRMANLFGKNLTEADGVRRFLAEGCRAANKDDGVSDAEFWRGLFLESKVKGKYGKNLLGKNKYDGDPNKVPSDPYSSIDYQCTLKYLAHGHERVFDKKKPDEHPIDSENFFRYFNLMDNTESYTSNLKTAIHLRNKYSHDTIEGIQNITADSLKQDIQLLQRITVPLCKKEDFPFADEIRAYWKRIEEEYHRKFSAPPIDLDDAACVVFRTDELTLEQIAAVKDVIRNYNINEKDGKIYEYPDRTKLEELLSYSMLRPRGSEEERRQLAEQTEKRSKKRRETTEKLEKLDETGDTSEFAENKPDELRLPEEVSAALRPERRMFKLEQQLQAVLQNFVLTADETLFESAVGRRYISATLLPLLAKEKKQLWLDSSVIGTMFSKFRSSRPSDTEAFDEERRRALEKLHKSEKNAIKALRALNEHGLIRVVYSPTTSRSSSDNLRAAALQNPTTRFWLLTMDKSMSEAAAALPCRNLVTSKPMDEAELLLFGATCPMLSEMRDPKSTPAPAPAPVPTEPKAPHSTTGTVLNAAWPDGHYSEIRLLSKIGEGGEGQIFNTNSPEHLAAKIYTGKRMNTERKNKLDYMVQHDPHIHGLCWPCAMLYTKDEIPVGFLMPSAAGVELALTVFHPGRGQRRIIERGWTRKSLAQIAANIASIFAQMHSHDILMGDINPRNFMVAQDCSVSFVDCDSYQVGAFGCPVGTVRYTPPERHREMKRLGRVDFGFTRTIQDEQYSLAVLLFEILTLGRAPYESRNNNNQDVVDAIIAGTFPYPYRSDDEDQPANSKLNPPVGFSRYIWSHTTRRVKTPFYNTFTNKKRSTAAEWAETMTEYVRQIELGHSTDELIPNSYKDISDVSEDGTEMVDLVCEDCGKPFNLGKDVYERRQANREPMLCLFCWDIQQNLNHQTYRVTCSECGKEFATTAGKVLSLQRKNKDILCPDCLSAKHCDDCGAFIYNRSVAQIREMRMKGKSVWCSSCLAKHLGTR